MPELVACPACGCRFQLSEAHLGRRTRCFACAHIFVAGVDAAQDRTGNQPPALQPGFSPSEALPLCPVCGRPAPWEALECEHCGEPFARENGPALTPGERRRDCEPHRGPLIATLGTISLVFGGLALCLAGLGVLISGPLGVVAWVMASRDLALMESGRMDSGGRHQTEKGRTAGIVGLVIGLLFAAVAILLLLVG